MVDQVLVVVVAASAGQGVGSVEQSENTPLELYRTHVELAVGMDYHLVLSLLTLSVRGFVELMNWL